MTSALRLLDHMADGNPSSNRNKNVGPSWGIRNMFGMGKNSTEASVSTNDSSGISRYEHDIAQAVSMRRNSKKNSNQTMTEEDILLGLNGLDQAESLKERGALEESLKVSEMSMELLIQFLKSDPSQLPNIDRGTISQRVSLALTEAESLKKKLNVKREAGAAANARTPATSPSTAVTSQALTQALAGAAKKVQGAATTTNQTHGQSTSSPQKRVSSPQHAQVASPSRGSPSKFFGSKDPMVQTVKSDLYIDQSQLQDVSWDDIAGLETAKQSLQENAILPMVRPDLFTGLRKPRNILLYGPPGTGKTLLVKAVAKESNCLLFSCTASSLTSKWHGEGEKLLRTLFQVARAAAPSIIFVDEMDALLSSRKSDGEHEASRRFKTEFMTQVDGIVQDGAGTKSDGKHLLLIACTNCPWDVDPAVMRRFPRRIYIPLPDSKARKALLKKLLAKAGNHKLSSTNTKEIVKRLSGFSGSDMSAIASEASFGPIRSLGSIDAVKGAEASEIRPISAEDFETAIDQATKSVTKKQIKKYDEWTKEQAAA